jgi:DNA-binding LacI/PurR family transcriptional regulator
MHGYQEKLWRQASQTALELGMGLITLVGESFIKGTNTDTQVSNTVFELALAQHIDSILLTGATLGSMISPKEYAKCLEPFRQKQIVSIGYASEGIPAININNRQGLCQIVEHLIEVHHKRRLVFVTGPAGSQEANERLAAFKSVLARYNLEFTEKQVWYGNFWYDGGENAVREFLDTRHFQFDALVAANDYMALGALRELQRRKIRVPPLCQYRSHLRGGDHEIQQGVQEFGLEEGAAA